MSDRVYAMENPNQNGSGDAGAYGQRSMGNGRNGNGRMSQQSPLEKFGQAKTHIRTIFKNILEYTNEVIVYVQDIEYIEYIESSSHVEGVNCLDKLMGYRKKLEDITNVLEKDHMKVVFFGRTSNGKSTTLNAMLREKLLPTGTGHTTNCFLQVEGSDSEDGKLLIEEEPDTQSVQSINQLANALSNVKLKENSLIRIRWPKEKCRLLRKDVFLMDSPGIDVTEDLDQWINKFCVDADVFILVSNAESTLTRTEKNFFHKVSARLSKPNIFILQNRWDSCAFEDNVDAVKQQHLDRNLQFLCEELKVVDREEGLDRVFFVSSREVLAQRLKESGTPIRTGILQEGFQERTLNFVNFEKQFEECISNSAVRTKFEKHTNGGKAIVTEQREIMKEIYRTASTQRKELAVKLDCVKELATVVEDVKSVVSSTLNDEIGKLAGLVDRFDRPFHADQTSINWYKKELHAYVENFIIRNLTGRCSGRIRRQLDNANDAMIGTGKHCKHCHCL